MLDVIHCFYMLSNEIRDSDADRVSVSGNKSSGSEVEPKPVEEEETVVDDSEKSSKLNAEKVQKRSLRAQLIAWGIQFFSISLDS